jgi:hypothetical protein
MNLKKFGAGVYTKGCQVNLILVHIDPILSLLRLIKNGTYQFSQKQLTKM